MSTIYKCEKCSYSSDNEEAIANHQESANHSFGCVTYDGYDDELTIEIYNRKTGEVIEVKKMPRHSLKGFMVYWAMQCDTKMYGYRIVAK